MPITEKRYRSTKKGRERQVYRDRKNRERVLKGSAVKADFRIFLFFPTKKASVLQSPPIFRFLGPNLFNFLISSGGVRRLRALPLQTSLSLLPPVALRPSHLTLTLRRAS